MAIVDSRIDVGGARAKTHSLSSPGDEREVPCSSPRICPTGTSLRVSS